MKKVFKFLAGLLTCVLVFTGCSKENSTTDSTPGNDSGGSGCKTELTLDNVNDFLNDADLTNTVAVIPFEHVNGFGNEWDFYALVNFVYRDRVAGYVKYQVTYLSCTCRTADVNYWQTAYIELTTNPSSGNAEDAELRALSFDEDGTGHYLAGFWGDSSPIRTEDENEYIVATYDKIEVTEEHRTNGDVRVPSSDVSSDPNYYLVQEGEKYYFPSIKAHFIPKLIGMTKAEIDQYRFTYQLENDDIMTSQEIDQFSGASVSTNNILRILHSVFAYHADTYF